MEEILTFLEKAEVAGKNITSVIGPQIDLGEGTNESSPQYVSYEARQLKTLFLKLHDA